MLLQIGAEGQPKVRWSIGSVLEGDPHCVPTGVCHGTLGELFQGPMWHNGRLQIAIISLPVDKFTRVSLSEISTSRGLERVSTRKCDLAVQHFCDEYGVAPPAAPLEFWTEIPEGQGMASSTADIVATIRCLYSGHGIAYDEKVVRDILRKIERSDSVFLDEFALYLSGAHEVVARLGRSVALYACFALEEGHVKTESLSSKLLEHYADNMRDYDDVRESMLDAFRRGDPVAIAEQSTRSADLSQMVIPRSNYDRLREHKEYFGADGLVVAHTGTVLGYLFKERPGPEQSNQMAGFFRSLSLDFQMVRCGF